MEETAGLSEPEGVLTAAEAALMSIPSPRARRRRGAARGGSRWAALPQFILRPDRWFFPSSARIEPVVVASGIAPHAENVLGGPLMDVRDSAAFLRISRSVACKLAKEDALRAVRVGRLVRSARSDVYSFVLSGVS